MMETKKLLTSFKYETMIMLVRYGTDSTKYSDGGAWCGLSV